MEKKTEPGRQGVYQPQRQARRRGWSLKRRLWARLDVLLLHSTHQVDLKIPSEAGQIQPHVPWHSGLENPGVG